MDTMYAVLLLMGSIIGQVCSHVHAEAQGLKLQMYMLQLARALGAADLSSQPTFTWPGTVSLGTQIGIRAVCP